MVGGGEIAVEIFAIVQKPNRSLLMPEQLSLKM
jgi:hypothetical protein